MASNCTLVYLSMDVGQLLCIHVHIGTYTFEGGSPSAIRKETLFLLVPYFTWLHKG